MVQVEGDAMRIKADVLKKEADKDGPLRKLLNLYNSLYKRRSAIRSPATDCTLSKNAVAVGCL